MAAFAALKHACVGGSDPRVDSRDGAGAFLSADGRHVTGEL